MNVARSRFRVDTSPDSSPDIDGPNRGAPSVSAYPERGSNPHAAMRQGILSPFSGRSASIGINPDRGENGSAAGHHRAASVPNEDRTSPEASPDLVSAVVARIYVDDNGCWIWQGAVSSTGYGAIRRQGRMHKTHQIMAASAFGPRPAGAFVCHTCDVRRCCNPAHLYYGSAKTNIADAIDRGRFRTLGEFRRQTTHCPQGHPYDGTNTFHRKGGGRGCRACRNAYARQFNRNRRAQGASATRGTAA